MSKANYWKFRASSKKRKEGDKPKQGTISKFFINDRIDSDISAHDHPTGNQDLSSSASLKRQIHDTQSPGKNSAPKRPRHAESDQHCAQESTSFASSTDIIEITRKVAESTVQKLNNFAANSDEKDTVKLDDIDINSLKRSSDFIKNIDHSDKDTIKLTGGELDEEEQAEDLVQVADSSKKSSRGKDVKSLPSRGNKGSKYTPLEQQVIAIKEKHPGILLFVECGYKYRFFGEDAEIAAKELHIFCHMDHNFMTASIPTYRLFVHVRRLVAKGYKVGVVKQTETAALKAAGENRNTPFTRQLTALYTKATLIGEDVDPTSETAECGEVSGGSGYILCVYEPQISQKASKQHTVAVVAVHPATGDIVYDEFVDDGTRQELETRITHLSPAELLLPPSLSENSERLISQLTNASVADDRMRLERLGHDVFNFDTAFRELTNFYSRVATNSIHCKVKVSSDSHEEDVAGELSNRILEVVKLPRPVVCCFYALLTYLQDFNLHNILKLTSNISRFTSEDDYLYLGACTVRNLELFKNNTNHRRHGSLLWVLDHTHTKFGSRLLYQWLAKPLRSVSEINKRLDAVSDLMSSENVVLANMKNLLQKLPDLEKGLAVIFHRKCSTMEFLNVCRALQQVEMTLAPYHTTLQEYVTSPLLRDTLCQLPGLLQDISHWTAALNEKAARNGDKTVLFVDESQFTGMVECKQNITRVKEEIAAHRRDVRLTLRCPSLEYNTVSGIEYLIEVKNSQINLVPKDWMKISATQKVSRFHSPLIVEATKRLSQLREQLIIESNSAWKQFLESFEDVYGQYKQAVRHLATIDCLFSLASVAKQHEYCRPTVSDDKSMIHIESGRHPVVDQLLSDQQQYVPNDVNLKESSECCMIITGPNMGGKSSYIKQVALISIMAHMGSYVPAQSATIGIMDAIYTRMGGSDDLFSGRSTFMVELQEAAEIIAKATPRSLVILDELGRGTSTHDGVAIAYASLKYFIEKGCLTLFVTHYPPLAEFEHIFPSTVANYHMSFMFGDDQDESDSSMSTNQITFLYQLTQGMAARSYGLNVARLADVPASIVCTATQKSKELEDKTKDIRVSKDLFKKLYNSSKEAVMMMLSSSESMDSSESMEL